MKILKDCTAVVWTFVSDFFKKRRYYTFKEILLIIEHMKKNKVTEFTSGNLTIRMSHDNTVELSHT